MAGSLVLWVETPHINCLLCVNGMPVGETHNAVSLSVASDGPCYVVLYPLENGTDGALLLPFAVGIYLQQGEVVRPLPDGATLLCAPDGALLLQVTLPMVHTPAFIAPHGIAQVRFSHRGQPHLATLFYEEGTRICIEEDQPEGQILAIIPIDGVRDGALSAVSPYSGAADLALQADTAQGPRFLLLSADAGFTPMIDAPGHGAVSPGVVTITADIGDLCRHQRRTVYTMQGAQLQAVETIGYFSSTRPALFEMDLCIAFCQCLLLRQWEEAASFLSPALAAAISPGELSQFFGTFDLIRPLYFENGTGVLYLGSPTVENCKRLREYRFTVVGSRIDAIIDPED